MNDEELEDEFADQVSHEDAIYIPIPSELRDLARGIYEYVKQRGYDVKIEHSAKTNSSMMHIK